MIIILRTLKILKTFSDTCNRFLLFAQFNNLFMELLLMLGSISYFSKVLIDLYAINGESMSSENEKTNKLNFFVLLA